jgi:hypothetical protein
MRGHAAEIPQGLMPLGSFSRIQEENMKLTWLERLLIKLAIMKNAARWNSPIAGKDSLKQTAQEAIDAFRAINAAASGTQANGNEVEEARSEELIAASSSWYEARRQVADEFWQAAHRKDASNPRWLGKPQRFLQSLLRILGFYSKKRGEYQ